MKKSILLLVLLVSFILCALPAYAVRYCIQGSPTESRAGDGSCGIRYTGGVMRDESLETDGFGNWVYTYTMPYSASFTATDALVSYKIAGLPVKTASLLNSNCFSTANGYVGLRVTSQFKASPVNLAMSALECLQPNGVWTVLDYQLLAVPSGYNWIPIRNSTSDEAWTMGKDGDLGSYAYYVPSGFTSNNGIDRPFGYYKGLYATSSAPTYIAYANFNDLYVTWVADTASTTVLSGCYQEDPMTSNQGGIDGNCGLSYSGNKSLAGSCGGGAPSALSNGWDGLYTSYLQMGSEYAYCYAYETYVKPSEGYAAAYESVRNATGGVYLVPIPTDCYSTSAINLTLRTVLHDDATKEDVQYYCLNGTGWAWVTNSTITHGQSFRFYDQGVVWMTGTITNGSVLVYPNMSISLNWTVNTSIVNASNHGSMCMDSWNLCSAPYMDEYGGVYCDYGNVTYCQYGCLGLNTTATDYYAQCLQKTCEDQCNVLNQYGCYDPSHQSKCVIDETTGCYKIVISAVCEPGDTCQSGSCVYVGTILNPGGSGTPPGGTVDGGAINDGTLLTGFTFGDRLLILVAIILISAGVIFGGGYRAGASGAWLGTAFLVVLALELVLGVYYQVIPVWVVVLMVVFTAIVITALVRAGLFSSNSSGP